MTTRSHLREPCSMFATRNCEARDIEAIGIPREYLLRLHGQGKLSRIGRGIYSLPDAAVTERHTYAEVAKRVPDAVLCLLSALAFHEITTQSPASVWIALGKGARKPAIVSPSLRVIRLTEPSLSKASKSSQLRALLCGSIPPQRPWQTVFKFRNKIGLDIAIEALKDCLRQKKATVMSAGAKIDHRTPRERCFAAE